MNWLLMLLLLTIGFILGIVIQRFRYKNRVLNEFTDIVHPDFQEADIQFAMDEWKKTIDTQMHFNELIIKFRSTVLGVFLTSIGIIYAVGKQIKLDTEEITILATLPLTFWVAALIMDIFYYHRLLMGSVKHALKFDRSSMLQKKGLLGMTNLISREVNLTRASAFIWLFYLSPLIPLTIIVIFFNNI